MGQGLNLLQNYNIHVITRNNVEQMTQKSTQRDVVIPNKLDNGETCQGLLRRFVYKNTNNNEISPHNDMIIKNVKNLFPYFPISLSLKKLRRFRIKSGMTFMKQPAFTLAEGATHVDLLPTKVKFAFTLAEVLITLGIIGIVAAMTIPNLITTHQQKVTVTKLQKAISVLNQAYKLSFDDVGEPEDAFSMGSDEYFKQYWSPYIKVSTICTMDSNYCGYNNNQPFVSLDGTNANVGLFASNSSRISFLTPDGFLYIIYTGNYATQPDGTRKWQSFPRVLVDINGPTGPNRQGRDVFWLLRTQNNGGGIQPVGYNERLGIVQTDCSYDASGSGAGSYCADYIRRSGWSINKDYPWEMKKNK